MASRTNYCGSLTRDASRLRECMNFFIKEDLDSEEDWRWIWQLPVPQFMQSLMWLVWHRRLLTNEQRFLRRIADDAACAFCNNQWENLEHVLYHCVLFVVTLWKLWNWRNNRLFSGDASLPIDVMLDIRRRAKEIHDSNFT